jgi:hypothetical protein
MVEGVPGWERPTLLCEVGEMGLARKIGHSGMDMIGNILHQDVDSAILLHYCVDESLDVV